MENASVLYVDTFVTFYFNLFGMQREHQYTFKQFGFIKNEQIRN